MEHEDGLAVGDVHTIHKVLIEVLLSKTVEENSVRLFENEVPLLLELKAQDALILELHQKLLRQCGFQIDSFGGTTFSISSLPFPLAPEKCAGSSKISSAGCLLLENGLMNPKSGKISYNALPDMLLWIVNHL